MTRRGIEPLSSRPLTNTLLIRLNLYLIQHLLIFFIWFASTKNKNLYSLYNVSKHKTYTVLKTKDVYKLLFENKLITEQTNYKQTHIPGTISL